MYARMHWAEGIHILGRHPPPETATAGDGTHPTGMNSCYCLQSLGQGNIFAPVWHSVHRGEYLDRYPLGRCTPVLAVHAGRYGQQVGGTHPTGMNSCYCLQSLGQGNIFAPVWHSIHRGEYLDRYPPGQVHPPGQCMLRDTGNKRAVRILLE